MELNIQEHIVKLRLMIGVFTYVMLMKTIISKLIKEKFANLMILF